MSRTTFLYQAHAVGITGHISLPVVDVLPVQASLASGIGETFGKVRVDKFKHLDYLSVGAIESHIVTSYSGKDKAHGTLASVIIEDLCTLHVVTCDRMVNRLTSKHKKDASEPAAFILHGTRFEGLRIAGHDLPLNLAVGLLSELSTWEELNSKYETDPAIRRELQELSLYPAEGNKLPVHNGVFACTLAHIPNVLPRGLKRVEGQGIYVPHFGTVYLAQYYITPVSRSLRMMHVDLGCSVEGCNSYGDTNGSGSPLPGNA